MKIRTVTQAFLTVYNLVKKFMGAEFILLPIYHSKLIIRNPFIMEILIL